VGGDPDEFKRLLRMKPPFGKLTPIWGQVMLL
jgi:hypothetical protein